ncbi:MAG: hypothetical protein M3Y08_10980 [Fibrobacterota bacterium]|nr:hypothetical protein [Fibrobacterota bacterium]
MLTDLHLTKYLQGLLSDKESKEVEAMLEKNPDMKARLEVLKNQSEVLGKPAWQRIHLERGNRTGSRTRYTTLLPALLMLVVVLMLAQHWFARPGENSTFTMSGGNGSGLELLYDSPDGWRYLDAEYKPTDSLTFSVRDEAKYHVAVAAVFGRGPDAEVVMAWPDALDRVYDSKSPKPVFLPKSGNGSTDSIQDGKAGHEGIVPSQILVFYDDAPLPDLPDSRILDLLSSHGNERGGLEFQYQVFSAGR